ncbi:MAG: hypothetical protein AB7L13_21740 [Acidimicrobiia bacterium]
MTSDNPYQSMGQGDPVRPAADDTVALTPVSDLQVVDGKPDSGKFTVSLVVDAVDTRLTVAGKPADTAAYFAKARIGARVDRIAPEPPSHVGNRCLFSTLTEVLAPFAKRREFPPAGPKDSIASLLRKLGINPERVLRAATACALRDLADSVADGSAALRSVGRNDIVRRFAYRLNAPLNPAPPGRSKEDGLLITTRVVPQRPNGERNVATDHFAYKFVADPDVPSTVGGSIIHTYEQWLYRTGAVGVSCLDGSVYVNGDKWVDFAGPPEHWEPSGRPTLPTPIGFATPGLDSGTQFDLVPDVEPQFMRIHVSGNNLGTYAISVSDFYCFGWVWPIYDGFWAC